MKRALIFLGAVELLLLNSVIWLKGPMNTPLSMDTVTVMVDADIVSVNGRRIELSDLKAILVSKNPDRVLIKSADNSSFKTLSSVMSAVRRSAIKKISVSSL